MMDAKVPFQSHQGRISRELLMVQVQAHPTRMLLLAQSIVLSLHYPLTCGIPSTQETVQQRIFILAEAFPRTSFLIFISVLAAMILRILALPMCQFKMEIAQV